METSSLFSPYEIVYESSNCLEIKHSNRQQSITKGVMIGLPAITMAIGLVLYVWHTQFPFLLIFLGITLFELILFAFIKTPIAVKMDSTGLHYTTISLGGRKDHFYIWAEINYLRRKTVKTKNATTLSYYLVLTSGKKFQFLSFANYHAKKKWLPEIENKLAAISHKEVRTG